jgi:uncharacterized integral membrane protein (TIGR00697 family)
MVTPRAPSPPVPRRQTLLVSLCALFVGFFVAAELLGAKLFEIPLDLGPRHLGLGESERFVATAGILFFPLTFILTDILNEYFGRPMVKLFTFAAIAVNLLLQGIVLAAIRTKAVSFTRGITPERIQEAYSIALGQTWAIVLASVVAFAIAQMLDVWVFTWLRHRTGGRWLWLRAQGSTVFSQLVDTFVVVLLAFQVLPALLGREHMTMRQAVEVSLANYAYKFAIAVAITPLLYAVHWGVVRYLGREEAQALAHAAHPRDPE